MKFITKYLWYIIGLLVIACVGAYVYLNQEPTQQSEPAAQEPITQNVNQELMDTKEQGKAFLETNGAREGVTTTASGLQYEVLESVAEGESPVLTSNVNVHYHGTTIDGGVFDSSVERGQPISFPLGAVIEGWQEGLQLMKVGEKFKFFIPEDIAYGDFSPSAAIPAGSTLIFEVELIGIE